MDINDKAKQVIASGAIKASDVHPHSSLNLILAVWITRLVGTMWCAYLFSGLALIALPQAIQTHSLTVIVNWASSNFAQLVLLPIILVGQQVISNHADEVSEQNHTLLSSLHIMNERQLEILELLKK